MMHYVEMMSADRQTTRIAMIDIPKEITDKFLYAANYFKGKYFIIDVDPVMRRNPTSK